MKSAQWNGVSLPPQSRILRSSLDRSFRDPPAYCVLPVPSRQQEAPSLRVYPLLHFFRGALSLQGGRYGAHRLQALQGFPVKLPQPQHPFPKNRTYRARGLWYVAFCRCQVGFRNMRHKACLKAPPGRYRLHRYVFLPSPPFGRILLFQREALLRKEAYPRALPSFHRSLKALSAAQAPSLPCYSRSLNYQASY